MPEMLAAFRGPVTCTRTAGVPGLTLSGCSAHTPGEQTALAFSAATMPELPATLHDVVVEHLGGGRYRISSAPREWAISATATHLHREIAAPFYRAIPPRPAPASKRLFWRVVLALAASRTGLAALRLLRR